MDALTHAIEGVTSTEWSPHGDAYSLQALRMIRDNLERAVADTSDEEARGNMLIAANLAIAPTGSARPASRTRCRIPAAPATASRMGSPTRSTCRR